MSLVLGTAGRAGEGRRAANGELVRISPSKRQPEHPTPPQEPAPPASAIAPGTGSFSRPPTPIPPAKIPTHLRPRPRENVPVPLRAASDAHRKPIGTNSGVRNNRPCHGNPPPLRSPASAQLERSSPTCSNRRAVPAGDRAPSDWGLSPPDPHRVQRSEFQRSISRTPRDLRLPSPTHTKTDAVVTSLGREVAPGRGTTRVGEVAPRAAAQHTRRASSRTSVRIHCITP